MLRTRRRDNNVKPNRRDSSYKSRLDRKSSRGMLYENEELRLKTININAEIERGQSDIKKLKRENELLKKEIWCLRDEYDKLDKLLKDKKLDFSSSSTTYSSSSESESCSSCTEDTEEVETSQNIENVQKTNLKNLKDQFDHLSVVTEETSYENSDRTSLNNRHSLPNNHTDNMLWSYNDKDVIKPDQSYPIYGSVVHSKSQTLPNQQNMSMNFFSPIQHSKSFDDNHFNQVHQTTLYPEDLYTPPPCHNNLESQTPPIAISPSPPLLYDNQQVVFPGTNCENSNFLSNTMSSNTTFSNGGNLEELLHDIESISQRGIPPPTPQTTPSVNHLPTIYEPNHQIQDFINQNYYNPETSDRDVQYSPNPVLESLAGESLGETQHPLTASQEKLHKSELNVVLMPKAMPLIGFDKYKNIQRSFESLNSKHLESLSASQQNLCVVPPEQTESGLIMGPQNQNVFLNAPVPQQPLHVVENGSNYAAQTDNGGPVYTGKSEGQEHNPFFFGNLTDNYVNSDYFSRRYNPETYLQNGGNNGSITPQIVSKGDNNFPSEQLENTPNNLEQQTVENEENIKLKTTKPDTKDKEKKQENISTKKEQHPKPPKLSITKKVSIHFKGKKEKERLKRLTLEGSSPEIKSSGSKGTQDGKKGSFFDFRINTEHSKDKPDPREPSSPKTSRNEKSSKNMHQKTPSIESKKSTTETSNCDQKTPNSTDSDKKNDKKDKDSERRKEDKKGRKSSSVSPDRTKHVHMMHEVGGIKKHKKHRRASRMPRGSIDHRMMRERSYSICTDRSMIGPGFGLGYSGFLYEDYSDRERTNSGSSCESHDQHRKMSGLSSVNVSGKVPWCGCWGNGCL